LQKQNTNGEEKRREDEMRNKEKMNHVGGVGFYSTILPTDLPTDIRIIFLWRWHYISVSKFHRYIFEFRTKILKIPPKFSKFVGIEVSKHARIEIAASVGKWTNRPRTLTVARIGICNVHQLFHLYGRR
jgi:hypothetical protein